jgi:rare lipoprotein A
LLALLAGCAGHREPPPAMPAPPPSIPPAHRPIPTPTPVPVPSPSPSPTLAGRPSGEIIVPKNAKILYTEVGYASWYGPGFQKRNAANGQPYDMNAMTAAHRTLPLSTIARVTDVKTGDSVLVRITDRGPFVEDRVIDLSRAAARQLSVFQKGVALVRIEVLETPAPIKDGGRWCVQIGAFSDARDASKLKEKIARRYRTAKVLQFSSPVGGDWLRIRVADDDKKRAQELVRETQTDAGVYLVRLD